MIDYKTINEWREEAKNTSYTSALGEYTPPEFLELLEAYETAKRGEEITLEQVAKYLHENKDKIALTCSDMKKVLEIEKVIYCTQDNALLIDTKVVNK